MVIRVLSFVLGIVCIALTIWLGYLTSINPTATIIAVFGIAAAIIAPVGLALITYSFRSSDKEKELITQLAKVPEISHLINEAKSQEEKIRILEQQRINLEKVIRVEAMQLALNKEKEDLQIQATSILKRLEVLEEEMNNLKIEGEIDEDLKTELIEIRKRLLLRELDSDSIITPTFTDYLLLDSSKIFDITFNVISKISEFISQKLENSRKR